MLSVHRRRALERQLRFYIFSTPSLLLFTFFYACFLFLFVRSSRSLISLAIRYSARFAISSVILHLALHAPKARRPIGSVKLSVPVRLRQAVNFRFARFSSAFPLICRGARAGEK